MEKIEVGIKEVNIECSLKFLPKKKECSLKYLNITCIINVGKNLKHNIVYYFFSLIKMS
jgi:hypothetical protein